MKCAELYKALNTKGGRLSLMVANNLTAYIIIFIAGLCFGSFLNVVVYRLPQHKSLVEPPSSCPSCGSMLGIIDLIPLLGYLLLKGRCRKCAVKISPRYPLVELTVGALFTLIFHSFGFTLDTVFYMILVFILLAVALIDLEHRIVPNTLVAAGLAGAALLFIPALLNIWLELPADLILERELLDAGGGFLLGGTVMLIILLVSRGGMGAGDMKLMALIGLYVGLRGTAVVMLLGFFFGAVIGLTGMALGKLTRKDALPFAPYLSLAALIQVLWGEAIINWYINLLN